MPVTQEEIDSIKAHCATSKAGGRCDECGFDWTIPVEEARGVIAGCPQVCRDLIAGRWEDAKRSPGQGVWSPSAYVWHMVDAIGIWAERLKALADDPDSPLVGFDQDDLAEVRSYERLSPTAGLWAFRRRVDDFMEALKGHDQAWAFEHPDFGPWTIGDVVRWMAHDLYHHQWDIQRFMARA